MELNLKTILSHTQQVNDCLEWTKCLNTDGYPRAVINKNNNAKVHRVVWELHNNSSASGKVVRHKCDNPKCINPDHLEIGTNIDNVRDRDTRERNGWAKLSHNDVRAARLMKQNNLFSCSQLAKMFGVSYRTMNSLLNFKHWKHVV